MLSTNQLYSLVADLILLVHFAFVLFVMVGFVLIWVGYFCRWAFVRHLWFRLAHLAAMGLVLAESLAGFICPLTTWENGLRKKAGAEGAYSESFIRHWLGRFLFYDLSEQTFTILYAAFFLFVALTFWIVRPRRRRQFKAQSSMLK